MGFNYKELALGEEFADLLREPSKDLVPTVDLEALGESLIANLNLQHDLYIAYLEQANRQRLAIVNRKLPENIEANVESERLIGVLSNLEQERIDITGKIAGSAKGVGIGAGLAGKAGRAGETAELAEEMSNSNHTGLGQPIPAANAAPERERHRCERGARRELHRR